MANKRLEDILNTTQFKGFVTIEGNNILGCVLGNIEQYYNGQMYNLKEMFVKNSHRGVGIGSKILNSLNEVLINESIKPAYLFTSKGDLTEKFYINNGFRTVDRMTMLSQDIS